MGGMQRAWISVGRLTDSAPKLTTSQGATSSVAKEVSDFNADGSRAAAMVGGKGADFVVESCWAVAREATTRLMLVGAKSRGELVPFSYALLPGLSVWLKPFVDVPKLKEEDADDVAERRWRLRDAELSLKSCSRSIETGGLEEDCESRRVADMFSFTASSFSENFVFVVFHCYCAAAEDIFGSPFQSFWQSAYYWAMRSAMCFCLRE